MDALDPVLPGIKFGTRPVAGGDRDD